MRTSKWLPVIVAALCSPVAFAASFQKAEMLYEHGLVADAKRELIDLLFAPRTSDVDMANARHLLGTIAFENDQIGLALRAWRALVAEHPESAPAKLVEGRIDELASIFDDTLRESVDNALALSYLRHGDFWSRNKSSELVIDSSWISNIDAALKWYNKVIQEFPGSVAARIAYEDKMRTLIGWEGLGTNGPKYGLRENFDAYIPALVSTLQEYEAAFPEASLLQAFRFQVAQAYWREERWNETGRWLERIIQEAGDGDSFYKDLATRRLQSIGP